MSPRAQLSWDPEPRSTTFDDTYASKDGAIGQALQVFIHGNDLPARWAKGESPVVAELGFGTGTNFCTLATSFNNEQISLQNSGQKPLLQYFAFEAYPLRHPELSRALRGLPEIADVVDPLLAAYPTPFQGFFPLWISLSHANILLTLCFCDATEGLAQCVAQFDAWLFDGFTPSRNPNLWSMELADLVRERSADHATFATYSASRAAKDFVTRAGFTYERAKGFGLKRERLMGRKNPTHSASMGVPETSPSTGKKIPKIALLGAGISGMSLSHSLKRRGAIVDIYESAPEIGAGASGNPFGLMAPHVSGKGAWPQATQLRGFYFSRSALLASLGLNHKILLAQGVRHRIRSPKHAQRIAQASKTLRWEPSFMSELTDSDAVFPEAFVIRPRLWLETLAQNQSIYYNQSAPSLDGYDYIIDTRGANAQLPIEQSLHFQRGSILAGNVTSPLYPDSSTVQSNSWSEISSGDPYLIPNPDVLNEVWVGATYEHVASTTDLTPDPAALTQLESAAIKLFPPDSQWSRTKVRTSIRASTHSGLPVLHASGDRYFVMSGFASRGFTLAPFCAEIFAAYLLGHALPVERSIAEKLISSNT